MTNTMQFVEIAGMLLQLEYQAPSLFIVEDTHLHHRLSIYFSKDGWKI